MRLLCSLFLLASFVFALTLDELRSKPSGYAKDLFLLKFLEQNITIEEANEAYFLTKMPKSEHSALLLKKSGSKKLLKLFDCMDSNITKILKKEPECAELGVNYKKISTALLSKEEAPQRLSALIASVAPEKSKKIDSLVSLSLKTQELDENSIDAYFDSSKEFRAAYFNLQLSDDELKKIALSKNSKRFIKWALFDKNGSALQKSLSRLDCRDIQDGEALFFLGLIKIKHGGEPLGCFVKSAKLFDKQSDKDRANFWAYLLSKNEAFLKNISSEYSLNFYSLIAKERQKEEFKNIEFIEVPNGFKSEDVNVSNPFYWSAFRSKLKNANYFELAKIAAEHAKIKDADAYYLLAKERLAGGKKELFLTPYKDAFADFNNSQKILLHAIGRQESLFIQGDVSGAYAIGVMQLIPLLAKELAEKRKEKLEFLELFEPAKNISYAATHFKWLESKVKHPTLIAISYNAGYGFFRRVEKEGLFMFNDDGLMAYEPFWSIENIPYDETRDYAKKVSINYAIYSQKFMEPTTLTKLLENLVKSRRKEFLEEE